ncbi:MAG: heme o synthase [Phycisphaerales bacterium]|jgi:protoheme IX farnesyltransferase|nr:heme o synthase [Phycisphaerales bacterium]
MENVSSTNKVAFSSTTKKLPGLYCELTKIRLSALVVVTTAVGFVMVSPTAIDWIKLLWTVLGTTFCAGAAAALNQVIERTRDSKMYRTQERPIPSGNLSIAHAFVIGVVLSYIGVAILSFGANIAAAGIALITILLYVLLYTPLKARTSLNTIIGAVVGALPPLIGSVAAYGTIETGGVIISGILFVWQLPHFLSLAWMFRDDYARGGFKMLPAIDESGGITSRASMMTCLLLIPLCLLLTLTGFTGILFAITGSLLGLWLTSKSYAFWKMRDDESARKLFFATITYLPILLAMMLIDRETLQWVEFGINNG